MVACGGCGRRQKGWFVVVVHPFYFIVGGFAATRGHSEPSAMEDEMLVLTRWWAVMVMVVAGWEKEFSVERRSCWLWLVFRKRGPPSGRENATNTCCQALSSPKKTMGCCVCDGGMVTGHGWQWIWRGLLLCLRLPPLLIFSCLCILFVILLLTRWSLPSQKIFFLVSQSFICPCFLQMLCVFWALQCINNLPSINYRPPYSFLPVFSIFTMSLVWVFSPPIYRRRRQGASMGLMSRAWCFLVVARCRGRTN